MSDDIEARRAVLRARFGAWDPVTLSGFLTRSAEKYGDRPFVITDERTASYAEIDAWATRLADGLAALGVRPGDRVGVLMANYLEFVPVKFAIARAGAVAIPFNYLYRQDELGYVLRQSRCHVLVTMTSFGGLDYLAMLEAAGLVALADKGYLGSTYANLPYRGKNKPESQKQANRAPAIVGQMTARNFEICIDTKDPELLRPFWRAALGYVDRRTAEGATDLVDPDGHGPAVWFQVVPEAKLAKNRIHLDIQAAPGEHEQLINELTGLGGTVLADYPRFTTLADPERNELCINRP